MSASDDSGGDTGAPEGPGDAVPGDPVPGDPVPSEAFGAVLRAFSIAGRVDTAERLAGGHIHGTWLVGAGGRRYVAQAVNRSVFRDLDACEANLDRIDRHLHGHPSVTIAPMRRTVSGAVHWIAPDGTPWRLADHLDGTVGALAATDAPQAHDVAAAFGRYAAALSTLPGPPLAATLARFHDLPWRRTQLATAADADRVGRLPDCSDVVAAIDDVAARVCHELDAAAGRSGPPAARAVHNDAKVANVRFDAGTGTVTAIVDLDTTMPGNVLFDLGELLRTATVPIDEDAGASLTRNVERTLVADRQRIEAVVRGFVGGLGVPLARAEATAAPWAGPMLAIENAARFAADHLDGDGYFGVQRSGQNLDRAVAQMAVARALLDARSTVAGAAS